MEDNDRDQLLYAGWEPDEGEGGTIWRSPDDGNWYEQERAIQLVTGGEDIGQSD